jgi:hypothetical protein
MDADILVAGGMRRKRAALIFDSSQFIGKSPHAPLDCPLMRFQPGIIHHQFRFLAHCESSWRNHRPAERQIRRAMRMNYRQIF